MQIAAVAAAASVADRRVSKRTSGARRWENCSDMLADTDSATDRSGDSRSGSTIPIERGNSSVDRPLRASRLRQTSDTPSDVQLHSQTKIS